MCGICGIFNYRRGEPVSRPLVEAMAMGVPVIAYDAGAVTGERGELQTTGEVTDYARYRVKEKLQSTSAEPSAHTTTGPPLSWRSAIRPRYSSRTSGLRAPKPE